MEIKELIAIMFACIIADNYVLSSFYGIESVGSDSGLSLCTALKKSLVVCAVLVVSVLVSAVVDLLLGTVAAYLETLVFAVLVLAVTCAASVLVKKFCPESGFCTMSIAVNTVVLGACLDVVSRGYGVLGSLLVSVGIGLGYLVAVMVVAGVRERINEKYVPAPFRGIPIMVAAMAIISMVLFAL